MTAGGWRELAFPLKVFDVLCVAVAATAGIFVLFSQHSDVPWLVAGTAALGRWLVFWRAHKSSSATEVDRPSTGLFSGDGFLRPPRQRWDQLRQQWGGVAFRHDSTVPVQTALGEVLAPSVAAIRSIKVASLARSPEYRIRMRLKGDRVTLTPRSVSYSWQPVFRGRFEQRAYGSVLVGMISWNRGTRFFTVFFPALAAIAVVVGAIVGLTRLAQGHFGAAGSAFGFVAVGLFFGAFSLLLSPWGARQARHDQAYLAEWLDVLLPPIDPGSSA